MGNKLEQELLEGKVTIIELQKRGLVTGELAEALSFISERDSRMDERYFGKENDVVFKIQNRIMEPKEINGFKIPPFAVITQNGMVYKVPHAHGHMNVSLWLLMNRVNLKNSVRLFAWRNSETMMRTPQFYDGYDLADCGGVKPKSIEHLRQMWNEYHEGEVGGNHIIEISEPQLIAIQNICSYFGTSFDNVMRTSNSFGLCMRPYEYDNPEDARKAKYNRLQIGSVLRIPIEERYIKKF